MLEPNKLTSHLPERKRDLNLSQGFSSTPNTTAGVANAFNIQGLSEKCIFRCTLSRCENIKKTDQKLNSFTLD